MRNLGLGIAIALFVTLFIAGCGGGGGGGITEERGDVTITYNWPEPGEGGLIPDDSNSIKVQVYVDDSLFGGVLLVKPASPPWTVTVTITSVPASHNALLVAQAYTSLDGTGVPQAAAEMLIVIPSGGTAYPVGGDEGDPLVLTRDSPIDHVDVTPNPGSVAVGVALPMTATAKDASGATVLLSTDQPFHWTIIGGVSYASVGQYTGIVIGLAEGSATVQATEQESSISGNASVTVEESLGVGKIAFTSLRDGNDEVYMMDANGSNQINLTNNATYDHDPSWALDASKLVFVSGRAGNSEIYLMNPDGSNPTNLTNNPAGDAYPCWSPDGSQIAFTSVRDGITNAEIYVMDADGTNQLNLTNRAGSDTNPCWSPDGSKIAFMSTRDGGNYELFVMDADGTNQTRLITGTVGNYVPSWSPDGSHIVFVSYRDDNFELYVMDADGTNQIRLTDNAAYDWDPCWSPDGSQIAFSSNRDGNWQLYVMDAKGDNQTRVTNVGQNYDPSWVILPAGDVPIIIQ